MRQTTLVLLLFFSSLRTAHCVEPQRVGGGVMTAALRRFIDDRQIAGVVAVVASTDRVLCYDAFGYSDVDAKTPMNLDAMFWIASMTKSMTAAALMMLVDEGRLTIDDPVEKHLPEFKNLVVADLSAKTRTRKPSHPVTIREMCSHSHGMAEVKTRDISLADDMTRFTAAPMDCDPGTRFRYSNVSLNVAGRLIEVLSGMSYADFMQQRLFTPLAMNDATFWPNDEQVARLARTFRQNAYKTGIENLTFDVKLPEGSTVPPALLLQYNAAMITIYANHYAHPSGGIYCTADDVLKFCQMLLGGGMYQGKRYLSVAAIEQMASIQTGNLLVNPQEGYGLGWFVQKRDSGTERPTLGSYGHRGARKTVMWIDPAKQLVTILLLQSFDAPSAVTDDLYRAFFSTAHAQGG